MEIDDTVPSPTSIYSTINLVPAILFWIHDASIPAARHSATNHVFVERQSKGVRALFTISSNENTVALQTFTLFFQNVQVSH